MLSKQVIIFLLISLFLCIVGIICIYTKRVSVIVPFYAVSLLFFGLSFYPLSQNSKETDDQKESASTVSQPIASTVSQPIASPVSQPIAIEPPNQFWGSEWLWPRNFFDPVTFNKAADYESNKAIIGVSEEGKRTRTGKLNGIKFQDVRDSGNNSSVSNGEFSDDFTKLTWNNNPADYWTMSKKGTLSQINISTPPPDSFWGSTWTWPDVLTAYGTVTFKKGTNYDQYKTIIAQAGTRTRTGLLNDKTFTNVNDSGDYSRQHTGVFSDNFTKLTWNNNPADVWTINKKEAPVDFSGANFRMF